jgi:hypothetical protein
MYRNFLTLNIFVFLALLSLAIPLAVFYRANIFLLILVIFSFYDLIMLFFFPLIPKATQGAMVQGMPLFLAFPKKSVSWFDIPSFKNTLVFLGAGNIFFPLLFFIATSVQFGISKALIYLTLAIIGMIIHLIWLSKRTENISVIPFLTMGILIGYLFF